jgi:uncharacterized protein HemX
MGVVFAEWSDKDTVNALLTGITLLIGAVSLMLVRFRRVSGELYKIRSEEDTKRDETRATREDSRTTQAFKEMKDLVRSLNRRVDDQDEKLAARDRTVDGLTTRVNDCEKDRSRLREQGRWMYMMLVKHGVISDSDKEDYPGDPPTPTTDEINIARLKRDHKPGGG